MVLLLPDLPNMVYPGAVTDLANLGELPALPLPLVKLALPLVKLTEDLVTVVHSCQPLLPVWESQLLPRLLRRPDVGLPPSECILYK